MLCAGAWLQRDGTRIPQETQRGYHVTVHSSNLALRHTVMASEANLMINPMAPVIGRAPRVANAWLAFGHGHVGMCGGASTGREIAHLVAGRPPQVDLIPFRAERFQA